MLLCKAVPEDPHSFESRKKLPEEWRGLRDDKLSEKVNNCMFVPFKIICTDINIKWMVQCGCPGAIFIHASGFIGGHKTYEGALQMAVSVLITNY